MRRALLATLATAFVLLWPLAASADEGWVIQGFAADITVRADASLHIVEAIDVDFGALQRHGIFREVPVRYHHDDTHVRVYRLAVISVTDQRGLPIPYEASDLGGYRRIKIGDANVLVSGPQSYRITYDVMGALNAFPDHDELFWNVNGGSWPVPTRAVTATVHAPASLGRAACFQGVSGSTDACAAGATGQTATFGPSRQLASGEQMTIVASLPKGAVAEPAAIIERDTDNIATFFDTGPAQLGLAALVLIGGIGWLAWRWYTLGRDRRERETIVPEYEPPDKLHPAELGLIVDESADTKDVTATIVDLAVRGYLTIAEMGERGLFATKDWIIAKTAKAPADLAEYERVVYDGLFDARDSVKISELKRHFITSLEKAESALYTESKDRGWFARRPDTTRMLYLGLAILAIVAGGALTWILGLLVGAGLAGLALVLVGMVAIPISRVMPAKTAVGAELLRRTLGFRQYMEVAEKDRARFAEKENIFSAYLPYAVVFGCVERWARAFAGIDTAAQTATWYTGVGALSALQLSSSLEGFSSNLGSAIAATTGSSGGSGFSGGGAGGGGGGGGGGSW